MRRLLLAALSLVACMSYGATHVWATQTAGWPLDGPAEILLGFGASYCGSDGSSVTHRGTDLEAEPGARVYSARGGTVTFAGSIPSGEGATMLAVTVESEGVRLSYMPLAALEVKAGHQVEPGAPLGALAPSGDRSSDAAHLHIGARVGDLYVDPMSYLVPPVPAQEKAEHKPVAETAPVALMQPAATAPVPSATAPTVPAPSTASVGMLAGDSAVLAHAGQPTRAPQPDGQHGAHATRGSAATGELAGAGAPTPASSPLELDPRKRSLTAGDTGAAGVKQPATLPTPAVSVADPAGASNSAVKAADRRTRMMPDSLLGRGGLAAGACVLGLVLLWPVWSASVNRPDPLGYIEDVAAAVLK